jgi:hypothetical protein
MAIFYFLLKTVRGTLTCMNRAVLSRIYQETGTISGVAECLGITRTTARKRLSEAGLLPAPDERTIEANRNRTAANRRRSENLPKPTPEECAEWQKRYNQAGSIAELGRQTGMSTELARYYLLKHGIETHRTGFKSPRTVPIATGADHHNWKGGTTMHADGYVLEYAPGHPAAATQKGYILQHRLVMEHHLRRYLTSDEVVHHRNEVKTDNRIENLELTNLSEHMTHHKDGFPRDAAGRFSY